MGIELYLTVAFWMGAIALFLRVSFLVAHEYPRTLIVGRGTEVILLLFQIAFFVGVCFLKFGGVQ
ncbi:MAG: hypothetical protein HOG49_24870 [Candidatus Scalindua sp.]|jgi:hypothetical protein|nr:hypothetical protein [Candidatus Scalindua sp.]